MSPNSKLKAILDQSEADTMKPVDDITVLSNMDKVGVPPLQVYHLPKLSNAPVPSLSGAKENASACPVFWVHGGTNRLSSTCELITIMPKFLYEIFFLCQTLDAIPT